MKLQRKISVGGWKYLYPTYFTQFRFQCPCLCVRTQQDTQIKAQSCTRCFGKRNEIKHYENSLLNLERNVPDGSSFTRTWECSAVLKDEAKVPTPQLGLSKDTGVTLVGQTPQSPLPLPCNSFTFHHIQRSDYSRSFITHSGIQSTIFFSLFFLVKSASCFYYFPSNQLLLFSDKLSTGTQKYLTSSVNCKAFSSGTQEALWQDRQLG